MKLQRTCRSGVPGRSATLLFATLILSSTAPLPALGQETEFGSAGNWKVSRLDGVGCYARASLEPSEPDPTLDQITVPFLLHPGNGADSVLLGALPKLLAENQKVSFTIRTGSGVEKFTGIGIPAMFGNYVNVKRSKKLIAALKGGGGLSILGLEEAALDGASNAFALGADCLKKMR